MVLAKALTIGPTPNPPIPRPARAEVIPPFGVVPARSSGSGVSSSKGVKEGRPSARRVLDRPLSNSSPSSLVSPLLGRQPTAFAQEMISSRLREEADEATSCATGDCECLRPLKLGRSNNKGEVWLEGVGRDDLDLVDRRESGTEEGTVEVRAATECPTDRRFKPGDTRSPSPSDSDVEQKTDSGSNGVLAPPVDLLCRSIAVRASGARRVPVGPSFTGVFIAGVEVRETPIAFRTKGRAITEDCLELRLSAMEMGGGGEDCVAGKENALRSRGSIRVLTDLCPVEDVAVVDGFDKGVTGGRVDEGSARGTRSTGDNARGVTKGAGPAVEVLLFAAVAGVVSSPNEGGIGAVIGVELKLGPEA